MTSSAQSPPSRAVPVERIDERATAVLHQTDLFLPPADPDDHYDLATQFALAAAGRIRLAGVLFDAPPVQRPELEPAIGSLGQLSAASGIATPFMIGRPSPLGEAGDGLGPGASFVLAALEASAETIDVHVVGSCRDIAEAARYAPELFQAKCRRLYLNAGSSSATPDAAGRREYNIEMDVEAFRSVFETPCDIYWMPCFTRTGERVVSEFSTHWSFDQRAFLERLSGPLRTYFDYALDFDPSRPWYASIRSGAHGPVPDALAERRSMWCTAGFLHSAGLNVDGAGHLRADRVPGVYEFVDADWGVTEAGHVSWKRSASTTGRKIFRVRDARRYEAAMTAALAALMQDLTAAMGAEGVSGDAPTSN